MYSQLQVVRCKLLRSKFPQLLTSNLWEELFNCFFDLEEHEWNSSEYLDKQDDENAIEDHNVNSIQSEDQVCEEKLDGNCENKLEAIHTYVFESDNETIDTEDVHEEVEICEVEKGDEDHDPESKLQCSNHSLNIGEPNLHENDDVDLNNEHPIDIDTQDPTIDFAAEEKYGVGNESKASSQASENKADSVVINENEDTIGENKIERNILNAPLTFASRLNNKNLTPDDEDTYQSQFSSALSNEEVEKGIQKNPIIRTKKPKYTYSRSAKIERTDNEKDLNKIKGKKISPQCSKTNKISSAIWMYLSLLVRQLISQRNRLN